MLDGYVFSSEIYIHDSTAQSAQIRANTGPFHKRLISQFKPCCVQIWLNLFSLEGKLHNRRFQRLNGDILPFFWFHRRTFERDKCECVTLTFHYIDVVIFISVTERLRYVGDNDVSNDDDVITNWVKQYPICRPLSLRESVFDDTSCTRCTTLKIISFDNWWDNYMWSTILPSFVENSCFFFAAGLN